MIDLNASSIVRPPSLGEDTFIEAMSNEDLWEQIQLLKDKLDELREEHTDLKEKYEQFLLNFQPGKTFLQGLIFKQVFNDVITVPNAIQTLHGPIDTYDDGTSRTPLSSQDARRAFQHAFYIVSAFQDQDTTAANVIYYGTTISVSGVSIAISRAYNATAPATLETYLDLYNNTGAEIDLYVNVYRVIGLQ